MNVSWCWKDHTLVRDGYTRKNILLTEDFASSKLVAHFMERTEIDNDDLAVAYFYCGYTQSESRRAKNVVGSLVAQLCAQLPCPEDLLRAFKESKLPARTNHPSLAVLQNALESFSVSSRIVILLDALDECEERDDLLTFLQKLVSEKSNISILVTCREDAVSNEALRSGQRVRMESHRREVDQDIESYIDHRLATDAHLRKFPRAIKDEIRRSLMEKSAGMYVVLLSHQDPS
jgi:hypothetical protein